MRIRAMIANLLRRAGDFIQAVNKEAQEHQKRISPREINSVDLQNCPHELSPELQALVDGVSHNRRLLLEEEIIRTSPTVRLFFRTDGEQAPIVTGHMIRSRVIETDDMDDQLEITVRVNAVQAASLPFVEVYNEHDSH